MLEFILFISGLEWTSWKVTMRKMTLSQQFFRDSIGWILPSHQGKLTLQPNNISKNIWLFKIEPIVSDGLVSINTSIALFSFKLCIHFAFCICLFSIFHEFPFIHHAFLLKCFKDYITSHYISIHWKICNALSMLYLRYSICNYSFI